MARKRRKVFISYRNEGGKFPSHMIREYLASQHDVFHDTSLKSGQWPQQLEAEIAKCDSFVLICTPGCFDRCHDARDVLRREIALAIKLGKHIVPVKIDGFCWPDRETLPNEISTIGDHQDFTLTTQHWDETKAKLMGMVEDAPPRKPSSMKGTVITGPPVTPKGERSKKVTCTETTEDERHLREMEDESGSAPRKTKSIPAGNRSTPQKSRKKSNSAATLSAWLGVACLFLSFWTLIRLDYQYPQAGLGMSGAALILACVGFIYAWQTERGFGRSLLGAFGGVSNIVTWLLLRS
jgi:hypothetical protein